MNTVFLRHWWAMALHGVIATLCSSWRSNGES